jgi:energy-converting hydrogenase A subunit M
MIPEHFLQSWETPQEKQLKKMGRSLFKKYKRFIIDSKYSRNDLVQFLAEALSKVEILESHLRKGNSG